jgi:hypothetical protein
MRELGQARERDEVALHQLTGGEKRRLGWKGDAFRSQPLPSLRRGVHAEGSEERHRIESPEMLAHATRFVEANLEPALCAFERGLEADGTGADDGHAPGAHHPSPRCSSSSSSKPR